MSRASSRIAARDIRHAPARADQMTELIALAGDLAAKRVLARVQVVHVDFEPRAIEPGDPAPKYMPDGADLEKRRREADPHAAAGDGRPRHRPAQIGRARCRSSARRAPRIAAAAPCRPAPDTARRKLLQCHPSSGLRGGRPARARLDDAFERRQPLGVRGARRRRSARRCRRASAASDGARAQREGAVDLLRAHARTRRAPGPAVAALREHASQAETIRSPRARARSPESRVARTRRGGSGAATGPPSRRARRADRAAAAAPSASEASAAASSPRSRSRSPSVAWPNA